MGLFSRDKYADGERIEVAGAFVRLRVSKRASRVSLRVDRVRREVVATAPSIKRLKDAAAFAHERASWMADRLAELPEAEPISDLDELRIFGAPVVLERGAGRGKLIAATRDEPARMLLPADDLGFQLAAVRLIKREALRVLTERTAFYCGLLDQPVPTVQATDAKTRWGSCKPAHGKTPAAIRYNWRLALAPFAVADYVVAHECAHLLEANHGPKFWALVREINGDPARHRAWLRAEGAALHAFGRA